MLHTLRPIAARRSISLFSNYPLHRERPLSPRQVLMRHVFNNAFGEPVTLLMNFRAHSHCHASKNTIWTLTSYLYLYPSPSCLTWCYFGGGVDANITAQLIKARVVTARYEEAAAVLNKSDAWPSEVCARVSLSSSVLIRLQQAVWFPV